MSRPYRIDWIANTTTFFGTGLAVVAATPLVLTTNIARSTNFATGVTTVTGIMPQDNVRKVSLTSATNLAGINFVITGIAENNLVITETLVGPGAGLTVNSVNFYWKIISIVPSATNAGTVSVGVADGYTVPFTNDYWNQASLLSFQVENAVGAINLTPQITDDRPEYYNQGTLVYVAQNWAALIPDQVGFVLPIVGAAIYSFRNFPVVSTRLLVNAATTGSFSYVTLQQGGKY